MEETFVTRETLLLRLKNSHDDRSWEEFVNIYRPFLFAVISSMNISYHDSEDLAQSVLVKAWEKLPQFDYSSSKGRFRNWLAVVARNEVRNFLMKKGRMPVSHPEAVNGAVAGDKQMQVVPEIEAVIEKEWQLYIAQMAWTKIKEKFSARSVEIFFLFSEGMSGAEIAEKTGVPIDTVYVYKGRVQKALMREIAALDDNLG